MRVTLLILAALATTALLSARISAQDLPPSIERSIGVTAAEFGVALAGSCVGTLGVIRSFQGTSRFPVFIPLAALTPAASAAMAYGMGAWLDPGGNLGAAVLGSYAGAALGFFSGYLSPNEDFTPYISLVGFPVGCALGSVIGYKLSRSAVFVAEPRCQLIPPSMGLALRRPAAGKPLEIAGVRVNLFGARF